MKYLIGLLLCAVSLAVNASVSAQQSQQIFNKMVAANHIYAELSFSNGDEINAYGGTRHVIITKGMLRFADKDVIIAVIAHELGHVIGYRGELQADRVSGRIGAAAGFNVCPGAYKFLVKGPGRRGGGTHPSGPVRYSAMCTKNGLHRSL